MSPSPPSACFRQLPSGCVATSCNRSYKVRHAIGEWSELGTGSCGVDPFFGEILTRSTRYLGRSAKVCYLTECHCNLLLALMVVCLTRGRSLISRLIASPLFSAGWTWKQGTTSPRSLTRLSSRAFVKHANARHAQFKPLNLVVCQRPWSVCSACTCVGDTQAVRSWARATETSFVIVAVSRSEAYLQLLRSACSCTQDPKVLIASLLSRPVDCASPVVQLCAKKQVMTMIPVVVPQSGTSARKHQKTWLP